MPAISIIVPAYNAENTIHRCIQSILDQTYTDFELLAMDDGSTDSTPQILDEFAAADARVHVVHKTNSGVSDTRNQALRLARGQYVQFLDADDWIAPMASSMFVHAMEDHPGCDMVISDFYRVIGKKMAEKGDIEEEKLITREQYAQEMMRNPADFYYGVLWNKFYRRSIIEENQLCMDVNLSWSEDFIFNMEYVLHADQIYVLKYPTYYYVKTEGSLVASQGASIAKTVQMKLAVIEYYSDFYKNIYTRPGSYYLRSPQIYSYLLNFAKDGAINPIGQQYRLGQNPVNARFAEEEKDNPFVTGYYNDLLLSNTIRHIAKGYALDEKDVQILLYLKLAGGTATVQEIRSCTALSGRALSAGLSRLVRRKIIAKVKKASNQPEADSSAGRAASKDKTVLTRTVAQPVQYTFGEESAQILTSLNQETRNIREVLMQGFSDDEKKTYTELRSRAAENVRSALGEIAPASGAAGASAAEEASVTSAAEATGVTQPYPGDTSL